MPFAILAAGLAIGAVGLAVFAVCAIALAIGACAFTVPAIRALCLLYLNGLSFRFVLRLAEN